METAMETAAGIVRIAITGPESTGKSWLAQRLAAHFGTCFVPEVAREFLQNLNRPYTFDDLEHIARLQMQKEEEMAGIANGLMFCDTELSVIRIWSEVKYGRCSPWLLQAWKQQNYPLFLLCDIDLPWEPDPLREHPDARQFLMDKYIKTLTEGVFHFHIISGFNEQRFQNALEALQK